MWAPLAHDTHGMLTWVHLHRCSPLGPGNTRIPSFAEESKRHNKGVPFGVVLRNPPPNLVTPAPGGTVHGVEVRLE